ncbi:MAG TPA: hypothetical protein VJ969_01970 [Desulfopila sp.]|nr:hypothetical protein [Desulfopila sp.]
MAKRWYEIPAICLLFLALGLVSTYPLMLHFDTGIPFDSFGGNLTWNRSGDQMQLLYWFWLVKENVVGNVAFDTNPFEFNMGGIQETTGFATAPMAFLYVLFSPFGKVAAYNCVILSSYVLSGVFMYLLVRLYSGSRAGALLGAIIFTFAPSRINGIAGGNMYGLLYFCYPWVLFFLEKGIQSRKVRYGVLSGLGLIFLSMLEAHLLYYICLFLAAYLPLRFVDLLAGDGGENIQREEDVAGAWPSAVSLATLWGAGISAVIYSQVLFYCRDNSFSWHSFWWIIILYPILPVLAAFCVSAVLQRWTGLSFTRFLTIEARSYLPLYVLVPLSILTCTDQAPNTALIVFGSIALVGASKMYLLRHYLVSMVKKLGGGIVRQKRSLLTLIPVIFALGYVLVWVPLTKVDKFSGTIAAAGRTLHDVMLFSSHLSDIFQRESTVYAGVVPLTLLTAFLVLTLVYLIITEKLPSYSPKSLFLLFFFLLTAFASYYLSLGLAFGKSSLYLLLYHYLPYFNYPRVSDRIVVLALFAAAVAVGLIVRWLQRLKNSRTWLAGVSFAVVAGAGVQLLDFNFHKPMGITVLDRGQDIYSYVKENIDDGLLLEIPLWPGDSHQSSLYQHYIMYDRIPRVNGYSPLVKKEYIGKISQPLDALNHGKMGRAEYELLQQIDVEYITVHNNRDVFTEKVSDYGPLTTLRRLKNSPYLEHIDIDNSMHFKTFSKKDDNISLFRVRDESEVGIADRYAAWYPMPDFYSAANRLRRQVGETAEADTSGKKIFQAVEGKHGPGFLAYGPYVVYPPGDYRCVFSLRSMTKRHTGELKNGIAADPAGPLARIEAVHAQDDGQQRVLAFQEIEEADEGRFFSSFHLDFQVEENANLEFRVFYYGHGTVQVEQVAVYKREEDVPLDFLEAEKMVGETGELVIENEALTGKAIEAIAGTSRKGDMVYGPNRVYSKNNYRASYYLRLIPSDNDVDPNAAAIILSVTDGQNTTTFARREIFAGEISAERFAPLFVDFALPRDEDLSFHVYFTGDVSLQLDRIEVKTQ